MLMIAVSCAVALLGVDDWDVMQAISGFSPHPRLAPVNQVQQKIGGSSSRFIGRKDLCLGLRWDGVPLPAGSVHVFCEDRLLPAA